MPTPLPDYTYDSHLYLSPTTPTNYPTILHSTLYLHLTDYPLCQSPLLLLYLVLANEMTLKKSNLTTLHVYDSTHGSWLTHSRHPPSHSTAHLVKYSCLHLPDPSVTLSHWLSTLFVSSLRPLPKSVLLFPLSPSAPLFINLDSPPFHRCFPSIPTFLPFPAPKESHCLPNLFCKCIVLILLSYDTSFKKSMTAVSHLTLPTTIVYIPLSLHHLLSQKTQFLNLFLLSFFFPSRSNPLNLSNYILLIIHQIKLTLS